MYGGGFTSDTQEVCGTHSLVIMEGFIAHIVLLTKAHQELVLESSIIFSGQ